jgi:acyl carrier protein
MMAIMTNLNTNNIMTAPENTSQVRERIITLLEQYIIEERHDFTETITNHMSFDYIGLDSLARVNLLVALEKEFSISLDPTAAYDFVTVNALAEFVWSVISGTPLDLKKTLEI